MIRWLLSLAIFVSVIITGISIYLQPDDLSRCKSQPQSVCNSFDAIVAISGGDTSARAREAVELYKEGLAKTLVFSGAAQDKSGPSNAMVMKQLAMASGVPESSIYIDEYANTTKENAENTETIFTEHNIKRVILVTSGYHQRRASLEFNKRAMGVFIANHPVESDSSWSFWWWTTPRGWWLALSELIKIITFYATGSIS